MFSWGKEICYWRKKCCLALLLCLTYALVYITPCALSCTCFVVLTCAPVPCSPLNSVAHLNPAVSVCHSKVFSHVSLPSLVPLSSAFPALDSCHFPTFFQLRMFSIWPMLCTTAMIMVFTLTGRTPRTRVSVSSNRRFINKPQGLEI